ncbi:MAG: hypothetical protein WDA53_01225 [Bacillota bacterium]
MEALKRVIRFQNYNLVKSLGTFWLVVLLLNIIASSFVAVRGMSAQIGPMVSDGSYTSFTGSNLLIIFIFFIIYGALMYHEDLAMALSCGVTRKDFYKGAIFSNIIVVLLLSSVQTTLLFIEKITARLLGYPLLTEFGMFNTSTDSYFLVAVILFVLFLALAAITNLIGILQFRWGYKFWIGFGVTLVIILNSAAAQPKDSSRVAILLNYLSNINLMLLTGLVVALMFFTLGYFFIRKTGLSK